MPFCVWPCHQTGIQGGALGQELGVGGELQGSAGPLPGTRADVTGQNAAPDPADPFWLLLKPPLDTAGPQGAAWW